MLRNKGVDADLERVVEVKRLVLALHDVGGGEESGEINLAVLEETVDFSCVRHCSDEVELLPVAEDRPENMENLQVEGRVLTRSEHEEHDVYLARILIRPFDSALACGDGGIRPVQPFNTSMRYGQTVHDHRGTCLFTGQHFICQAVTSWQFVALDNSRYQRTHNLIARHIATMRHDILHLEERRQMYLIRFHAD